MNIFKKAVRSVPEIHDCFKDGLQALGSNSSKIKGYAKGDLVGSVNIDTCLKNRYPNASRWDYVFGCNDRIYYVEVHQGKTSEVTKIVEKLNWLKQWHKTAATSLENLKDRSIYHWVSTKGTASIAKGSRHRRRLDQNGIRGPSAVLRIER